MTTKQSTPELTAKHFAELQLMLTSVSQDLGDVVHHLAAHIELNGTSLHIDRATRSLTMAVERMDRVIGRQSKEMGYKPKTEKKSVKKTPKRRT